MAAKTTGNGEKYSHLIDSGDTTDEGRDIPETFRAFDSFPAGNQCDLTIADLPDDEMEYGWTNHYENESRQRTNPDVTDELIETLLTTGAVWGTPEEKWDDRYLVQKEIDGYEWTLVVADDGNCESEQWVLITIYSNYHGSVGTTNKYFDRLRERRQSNEEDGSPESGEQSTASTAERSQIADHSESEDDELRERRQSNE